MDLAGAKDLARRDKYQFQWWANWLVGVQNYRDTRKGPDRGIDGIIYFRNGPRGTGRVIVSVKGGAVGIVNTAHGKFPKVQIATIEELLDGGKPRMPPIYEVSIDDLSAKKSGKKLRGPQLEPLLTVPSGKQKEKAETFYPAEENLARLLNAQYADR